MKFRYRVKVGLDATFTYRGITRYRIDKVCYAKFLAIITCDGELDLWLIKSEKYLKELERMYRNSGYEEDDWSSLILEIN